MPRTPPWLPSAPVMFRSAALGLSAGARSSLGVAAPVLHGRSGRPPGVRSRRRTAAAVTCVGWVLAELVADKLPQTPSRLDRGSLAARVATAVCGSALLCRRAGEVPLLPLSAAAAGAAVGSYGGAAWRTWSSARAPAWLGAVLEDVVALVLAGTAARDSD